MISAVLVTYNEAQALKRCLHSIVGFADELVIVDLGSTDDTLKVAKQFRCRVISHPFVPYVELVRNFAIEQCTGNWILVLDPDEQLSRSLKSFLARYATQHRHGVLNIPRKNIFFNTWIRHTNFWPDCQIRFFSAGTVHWENAIHSYPTTTVQPMTLPFSPRYAIIHHGYTSITDFYDRQNRYSTIRAQQRFEAGERFSWWSLCARPFRELLLRGIKHQGYLDAKHGLFLVTGLMLYHIAVEWKLWELNTQQAKR